MPCQMLFVCAYALLSLRLEYLCRLPMEALPPLVLERAPRRANYPYYICLTVTVAPADSVVTTPGVTVSEPSAAVTIVKSRLFDALPFTLMSCPAVNTPKALATEAIVAGLVKLMSVAVTVASSRLLKFVVNALERLLIAARQVLFRKRDPRRISSLLINTMPLRCLPGDYTYP